MAQRCEWDPKNNRPAYVDSTEGCQNEAMWLVGSKGEWLLCDACAQLPRFRLRRVRKNIGEATCCREKSTTDPVIRSLRRSMMSTENAPESGELEP
jgi:hypothetical protein